MLQEQNNDFTEILGNEVVEQICYPHAQIPNGFLEYWDRLESNQYYFLNSIKTNFKCTLDQLPKAKFEAYLRGIYEFHTAPELVKTFHLHLSEMSSLEKLIQFFIQAFIELQMNKGNEYSRSYATNRIRDAETYYNVMTSHRLHGHGEYMPAVKFLSRWTQLYINLERGRELPKENATGYDAEEEFQNLPDKSKALVLGAKYFLLSPAKKKQFILFEEDTTDILRQVVKLDQRTYEWHHNFGPCLRFERRHHREDNGLASQPSEEELQIFWETYEFCDYQKYEYGWQNENESWKPKRTICGRIAWAGCLQAIAGLYRYRHSNSNHKNYPLEVFQFYFHNEEQIRYFILNEVEILRETSTTENFEELLRVGEIVGIFFPFRHRQYETALNCFQRAQKLRNDSKINHRLGTLFLVAPELCDEEKSLQYLRQAVKIEICNFPAAMDLINVLLSLSSPTSIGHEDEITCIVNALHTVIELSEEQEAELLFDMACLNFMIGKDRFAVGMLIQCHHMCPAEHLKCWQVFHKRIQRYKWNPELLNHDTMETAINEYLAVDDVDRQDNKSFVQSMLEECLLCLQEPGIRTVNSTPNTRSRMPVGAEIADGDENWRSISTPTDLAKPSPQFPLGQEKAELPKTYVPPHKRNQP